MKWVKFFALVLREDITIAFKQKFSQLAKDVYYDVALSYAGVQYRLILLFSPENIYKKLC